MWFKIFKNRLVMSYNNTYQLNSTIPFKNIYFSINRFNFNLCPGNKNNATYLNNSQLLRYSHLPTLLIKMPFVFVR